MKRLYILCDRPQRTVPLDSLIFEWKLFKNEKFFIKWKIIIYIKNDWYGKKYKENDVTYKNGMIEGTSYIVSLNRKPYPQGWTEKYGKYLKELTNLIHFLARNRRFFYDTFYLNQTNLDNYKFHYFWLYFVSK